MKKLITILFLMIVAFVNAQDSQETLKWLNNHKKHIAKKEVSGEKVKGKIEMTESYIKYSEKMTDGNTYERIINWGDVGKILCNIGDSGRYYITIFSEKERFRNIAFTYSEDGFDMVVKLEQMAKLHGADVEVSGSDLRGIKL